MRRIKITMIVLAGISVAAIALPHFRGDLRQAQLLANGWMLSLQTIMNSNWIAFGLGQMLVAATGILPASMIAIMAGATMGFGWGLLLSTVTTMLGGWIAFLLSRSALRGSINCYLQRHPAAARVDQAMTAEGWRMVALLRISPVMPFALTSYAIGLTRISHRDFLAGTLASLPALIGYVALGALGRQDLLVTHSNVHGWGLLEFLGSIIVVFYALMRIRKAAARIIWK